MAPRYVLINLIYFSFNYRGDFVRNNVNYQEHISSPVIDQNFSHIRIWTYSTYIIMRITKSHTSRVLPFYTFDKYLKIV